MFDRSLEVFTILNIGAFVAVHHIRYFCIDTIIRRSRQLQKHLKWYLYIVIVMALSGTVAFFFLLKKIDCVACDCHCSHIC